MLLKSWCLPISMFRPQFGSHFVTTTQIFKGILADCLAYKFDPCSVASLKKSFICFEKVEGHDPMINFSIYFAYSVIRIWHMILETLNVSLNQNDIHSLRENIIFIEFRTWEYLRKTSFPEPSSIKWKCEFSIKVKCVGKANFQLEIHFVCLYNTCTWQKVITMCSLYPP